MLFPRRARPAPAPPSDSLRLAAIERSHLVLCLSADWIIRSVNPAFCTAAGYRPEDLVGQSYDTLLRQKDRGTDQTRSFRQRVAAGADVAGIMPHQNREGQEIWLDLIASPILGADGGLQEILITAHDITAYHLRRRDNRSQVDAVARSMAVIEFDLSGNILAANDHFLKATGYAIDEIRGRHHRILMPEGTADGPEYRDFWSRLASGTSENGQVMRIGKGGRIVWLEATYETLIDPEGRPFKVVKYAFDVTRARNQEAEVAAKLAAIETVQAVIEFDASGKVLRANDIFCKAMGYRPEEIEGRSHAMFLEPSYAASDDYRAFWDRLRAGQTVKDQFKRIGKGGREVWIEASYNPIRDAAGKVVKVVKFAVDTTAFRVTVEEAGRALRRLSEGDLAVRIDRDLGDLDAIRSSFNDAAAKVDSVIAGVLGQSGELVAESAAIRGASDDLSRRTEQQAATLEQSAAALEQLASSVRGTTGRSKEARSEAHLAKEGTRQSAETITVAMESMNRIAASSQKISKITSVIDDISFQTNLLALNAGIEAARAGDAGRGFAVVASEVRGLAQRSADAAREIADLIAASGQQVADGVQQVGEAEKALRQIDQRVNAVLELILSIAASAEEQSMGLGELNRAISDLDRVTQQNAAMAEETNAAVQSFGGKVERMRDDAAYFTTSANPGATSWTAEGAGDRAGMA